MRRLREDSERANTTVSVIKIIIVSIILIALSGFGVMAATTQVNTVKILFNNGYEMNVLTSKTNVKDILKENNIILEENERVIPGIDEDIQEGQNIVITTKSEQEVKIAQISEEGIEMTLEQLLQGYTPITEKIVVEQVEIPFETVTKDISDGEEGSTNRVVREGQNGIKEVTYKIKYQNNTELERTVLSEVVIKQPVEKIIEVRKPVTSRSMATSRSVVSYGNGVWSYDADELDLICAITAQESNVSYDGALAVITCACNRAERKGTDPLTEYKAKGQFCYTIDNAWRKRLNGHYASYIAQAVNDALNGKRNHNYTSFRAAGRASGEVIGGNVYF